MSNVAFPPTSPDIFGPIVTSRDVRQALRDTIRLWATSYIDVMAARSGLDLPPIGHWEAIYEDRAMPADQQVACWVTTVGTDPKHPPTRQGDGTYLATWLAQANLVIYGRSWDEAHDRMALYSAAIRAAVAQHGSLGGFASATVWLGDATQERERQRTRTVLVGIVLFRITVNGAVNTADGPKTAPAPPGASGGPTVDQVNITINKEPIT